MPWFSCALDSPPLSLPPIHFCQVGVGGFGPFRSIGLYVHPFLPTTASAVLPCDHHVCGWGLQRTLCASPGSARSSVSTGRLRERLFLVRALGSFTSQRKLMPRSTDLHPKAPLLGCYKTEPQSPTILTAALVGSSSWLFNGWKSFLFPFQWLKVSPKCVIPFFFFGKWSTLVVMELFYSVRSECFGENGCSAPGDAPHHSECWSSLFHLRRKVVPETALNMDQTQKSPLEVHF